MADFGIGSTEGEAIEKSFEVGSDVVSVESVDKSLHIVDDLGRVESIEKSGDGVCNWSEIRDGVEKKIGDLGILIEDEMGKVSLGGEIVGTAECETEKGNGEVGVDENNFKISEKLLVVEENGLKSSGNTVVNDEEESDGESESESESASSSSSSSLSSSSSSSSSDDDDEDDDKANKRNEKEVDMEEGEISDLELKGLAAWSDDEDGIGEGSVVTEPIRSKNEVQDLPPVPPVNAIIEPHHQTVPVGAVLSMLGAQVIVEGVDKHNPLSEGSILWITESRSPLGIIDEIFGPVKNPYYIVRYNSESEVPSGIHQGSLISFVPEFADYVLNDNSLYKKGYDASGEHDEELSNDVEFSDDEKEAEYRRNQKMSKRATNDQTGTMKEEKKKFKNRGSNWKNNVCQPSPTTQFKQYTVQQPPSHASSRPLGPVQGFPGEQGQTPTFQPAPQAGGYWKNNNQPSPATQVQQDTVQQPPSSANSSRPQGPVQGFPGGPGLTSTIQPPPLAAKFISPSSGVWTNGMPYVHPQSTNMGYPNGLPANMPWMQQNYSQQPFLMPLPSGVCHQQFNAGQMYPNLVLQGQPNFFSGPSYSPWPASMGQNAFNQSQFTTGFPSPAVPQFMNVQQQGGVPNGPQVDNNSGLRPPLAEAISKISNNPSQGGYSNVQTVQQQGVPYEPQLENNSGMELPFAQVSSESSWNSSPGVYTDCGGRQPFQRGGGRRFRGGRGRWSSRRS